MAKRLGKQYPAVAMRTLRLGLGVDVDQKFNSTSTSKKSIPSSDLLTPEGALNVVGELEKLGFDKVMVESKSYIVKFLEGLNS